MHHARHVESRESGERASPVDHWLKLIKHVLGTDWGIEWIQLGLLSVSPSLSLSLSICICVFQAQFETLTKFQSKNGLIFGKQRKRIILKKVSIAKRPFKYTESPEYEFENL